MRRSSILLIGIVTLLVSCSQRGALLSISRNPVQNTTAVDYLRMETGPSGEYCAAPEYTNGSEFVRNFSAYSQNMPFPIVSWASDARRKGGAPNAVLLDVTCLDLPGNNSWNETLKRIGKWVGTYHAVTYAGFVEIVWADRKDEVQIRNSMKEWIPPIVFRSRYAVDYLAMWHAISGMELKYDPALIAKALEYDKARLLEESDPDLPLRTERSEWPFPLGFVNFMISKKTEISDFMPILAAHLGGLSRLTPDGWMIESFQRNDQGLNLIHSCLNRMKDDWWDFEDADILSRIGTFALPEVIHEFKSTDADPRVDPLAYERQLIATLSRISSPERDEALVSALKGFVSGKRGSINLDLIIEALMSSNCQAAIPVLEEIASNDNPNCYETRSFAKTALYALGRLIPIEDKKSISISPKAKGGLDTEVGKSAIEILYAVLVQTDNYEPGMEILSFNKTDSEITLSGKYATKSKTVGNSSSWNLTIPLLCPDRALVTFGYVCGKLCGQGYRGKLNKRNGQWTISRWQKTWMS
jgi:hypothetical protein